MGKVKERVLLRRSRPANLPVNQLANLEPASLEPASLEPASRKLANRELASLEPANHNTVTVERVRAKERVTAEKEKEKASFRSLLFFYSRSKLELAQFSVTVCIRVSDFHKICFFLSSDGSKETL